jgi:UDP-N-acetylmuramate dehydrogenase
MLPEVRGEYFFNFKLEELSTARIGGKCDVLFYPLDIEDLVYFMQNKPLNLDTICLGNLSNTLVQDSGFRGCVVNLSKFMIRNSFDKDRAYVEAGSNLSSFIANCVNNEISCCEKLHCIPGTIGGAIAMNAGIPGFEIADVLLEIDCIDHSGKIWTFKRSEIDMKYRSGNINMLLNGEKLIIVAAVLKTHYQQKADLLLLLRDIAAHRRQTQPIDLPTLGCIFKNPPHLKAWNLIKEAGCGQLRAGGASISHIHMNFLVNSHDAKATDFLKLIQIIKNRVLENSGILLEEEIIIIGDS